MNDLAAAIRALSYVTTVEDEKWHPAYWHGYGRGHGDAKHAAASLVEEREADPFSKPAAMCSKDGCDKAAVIVEEFVLLLTKASKELPFISGRERDELKQKIDAALAKVN